MQRVEYSLQANRFSALITTYSSDDRVGLHEHENPYLSFVLAGGHAELTRNLEFDCPVGAFGFHPAGDVHRNVFYDSGLRELSLLIRPEWLNGIWASLGEIRNRLDHHSRGASEIGHRIAAELVHPVSDSPAVIENLALAAGLFALRSEEERPGERWIADLDQRIRKQGCERLELLGYHPAHICRAYRRRYGRTPAEADRAYRIARAKRLLAGDDLKIGVIAAECGFADHSHFGRWFRRFCGMTPARYRDWYRRNMLDSF